MIPASYAPRDPPPDKTKPIRGRDAGACTDPIVDATRPVGGCPTNMKLAALGAILAVSTVTAHAETAFDEYSETLLRRPTQQLVEAACDLDIQVRGAVATFEVRHRITNPGPGALASSYYFDLPRGATLTGFSLRAGAATEQALAIPGQIPSIDADARPVFGVDPAFVESLPEGSPSQYALRLQPLNEAVSYTHLRAHETDS